MEWNTNTAEWFESVCCFLQLLYFVSFAQQSAGQVAKHHNSATIQCAGAGWDNLYLNLFNAAKTLFWNFLINLESVLSLGLFLLRNQRNILVCKKCCFPTGTNRGFLTEHLICKNVQPWLRVLFASTSQPSLYLVPYRLGIPCFPPLVWPVKGKPGCFPLLPCPNSSNSFENKELSKI